MAILTILIILIQENRISFFISSSISFINVKQFSFASLVKFISSYFILFDAILNEIVSLFSHSDISLLMFRNATDFYLLILRPAALLNLFITSDHFQVETLGFFI